MPPESRKVRFAGSGGADLAARLDLPAGRPNAFALFAHCFTCSKDSVAAARISRGLTEAGLAVLRFDFTGLGQSDGDFGNTDFTSNVEDLVRAADHLRDHFAAPAVLIGHSLGGAAVLAAGHRVPEVRAVATIGAPADPAHIGHLIAPARPEIERCGEAEVVLGGRRFRIREQFLADIAEQPQRSRIHQLDAALLVLHSPQDEVVGIENARTIFDAARHPKSFVALDGFDHLLTRRADAQYAVAVLAAWTSRYVPPAVAAQDLPSAVAEQAGGSAGSTEPPPDPVVLAETGTGRFTQRISAGRHLLAADEPAPIGTDTGSLAVRSAARSAGRLHLDDGPHVRRPQGLATGAGHGAAAAFPDPRRGLRTL